MGLLILPLAKVLSLVVVVTDQMVVFDLINLIPGPFDSQMAIFPCQLYNALNLTTQASWDP